MQGFNLRRASLTADTSKAPPPAPKGTTGPLKISGTLTQLWTFQPLSYRFVAQPTAPGPSSCPGQQNTSNLVLSHTSFGNSLALRPVLKIPGPAPRHLDISFQPTTGARHHCRILYYYCCLPATMILRSIAPPLPPSLAQDQTVSCWLAMVCCSGSHTPAWDAFRDRPLGSWANAVALFTNPSRRDFTEVHRSDNLLRFRRW